MPLKVGDKAPEFVLVDTDRKPRSLKEFLGRKTVLAFYPAAFTGVCTKEMCTFRDTFDEIGSLDATVVGISVDPPFANKAFAQEYKIPFALLSDFTRHVSSIYTGLYVDLGGVPGYTAAKRSVFVLDREGIVRYAWISEQPAAEPNYDDIKSVLLSL
ncbi:MAG TPA: redoxin domain-containing protein [Bacteroidota bacterium]|nr:redoxin domain-containing protein [Bacteroidota bacterium]